MRKYAKIPVVMLCALGVSALSCKDNKTETTTEGTTTYGTAEGYEPAEGATSPGSNVGAGTSTGTGASGTMTDTIGTGRGTGTTTTGAGTTTTGTDNTSGGTTGTRR
jgi:hypothetical protein